MKKILITGGTGFIGRNLKEELSKTYSVFAPAHIELELLDEQTVAQFLKSSLFDIVIHAANWDAIGNPQKDPLKVVYNNLRMFCNLSRCSDYYKKMIYFGSGAEYDQRHYIPRMKEEYFDVHVPVDDYGFSKYIIAKHTEYAKNIYNLRLFAVYGKYEDWKSRFISNACCRVIYDLPITINQNACFDYLYIDDLIKITRWFIENKPRNKSYNVCTGNSFELLSLAKKVLTISKKDLGIKIIRDGFKKQYSGDNARLLSEINGYVFRNIDNCIEELYNWYLINRSSIDKEKLLN